MRVERFNAIQHLQDAYIILKLHWVNELEGTSRPTETHLLTEIPRDASGDIRSIDILSPSNSMTRTVLSACLLHESTH